MEADKPTNTEPAVPGDLLVQVRKLIPKRALTYGESLNVARVQAAKLRKVLGVKTTAMPLKWITRLPNLRCELVPAHQLGESISGLTTRVKDGDYLIAVNRNNSLTHQRFSLAHEVKHLLDYPYADTLHARLGYGNESLHERHIERICDYFAAHLLMPSTLVKRVWGHGFQDIEAPSRDVQGLPGRHDHPADQPGIHRGREHAVRHVLPPGRRGGAYGMTRRREKLWKQQLSTSVLHASGCAARGSLSRCAGPPSGSSTAAPPGGIEVWTETPVPAGRRRVLPGRRTSSLLCTKPAPSCGSAGGRCTA
jgi:hypothetical protein